MKAILMLLLLPTLSFSQKLVFQYGVEKTISGYRPETSLLAENNNRFGLGGFYQIALTKNYTDGRLTHKDPFWGLVLQVPVVNDKRLALLFVLKNGFVNENFFVIVPSIETQIRPSRRIGVSIGTGLRYGAPSLSMKMFVKLF